MLGFFCLFGITIRPSKMEVPMSLLQQDATGVDDAARGEELTKGSSHVVWAAIAARLW